LGNLKLGEIKPHIINGKMIFTLDERWINYFKSKPIFQVVINKNQIMLIGPKIVQGPTTDKPTSAKMEVLH